MTSEYQAIRSAPTATGVRQLHAPSVHSSIYRLVCFVLIILLAASPFIPIDTYHRAIVVARPTTEPISVKASASGFLLEAAITPNQVLKRGDLIATIDARGLRAEVESLTGQRHEIQKELADLQAMISQVATFDDHTNWELSTQVGDSASSPSFQTRARGSEWTSFEADFNRLKVNVLKTAADLVRLEQLYARGIVSEAEKSAAEFARQLSRADRTSLVMRNIANWQKQLEEGSNRQAQIDTKIIVLNEQIFATSVTAPCDGFVLVVAPISPGLAIAQGTLICVVIPDTPLVFDASIAPKDIAKLRVDQTVSILLDALPYTDWGILNGRVQSISPDIINDNSGTFFRVKVEAATAYLSDKSGAKARIVAGMNGTGRFFGTRTSLFRMMFDGVNRNFNPRSPTQISTAIPPQINRR